MNKTGFKALILLLSMILALGIDSCSHVKTKQVDSTNKSKNTVSIQSSGQDKSASNTGSGTNNSTVDPSLHRYARENPFIPLVVGYNKTNEKPVIQQDNEAKDNNTDRPKTPEEKPIQMITIRLIGIVGDSTAFFDEGGLTRTVSAGDFIAKIKVLEIRDDEVTLSKNRIEYKVKTGEILKVMDNP